MAEKGSPSYTDLVYEVLRSADRPLTFQEIFDEVSRRRPVTTRNPKATIRSALTQGRQLVSLGDGLYGYLPHLLRGSLLRIPLTEKKPANNPLTYPDEVRHALWPTVLETQKRSVKRPARLRLPDGDQVALPLEFLGNGVWGSHVPERLRRYLIENHAAAGDSLLLRVVDGEAGDVEAWFESRLKQDRAAVAKRNQELADAAYEIIRRSRSREVSMWDLAVTLLAKGIYCADVAPAPLEEVLNADPRFVDAGLHAWMLAESVTPETEAIIRERKELEAKFTQIAEEPEIVLEQSASPQSLRYAMERSMADISAVLAENEFESVEEANAFLQELLAKGGVPRRTAETRLERAQELMYDAWESGDTRERVQLARKALDLSPDCADAYVLLAEETARSPKEAAELYAEGVAAGERALGKETFEQEAGHFWGMIETRPYMRARLGLAHALWAMGRRQEAIDHAWDMLRLNPNDNQGVRYVLLNWLLEIGDGSGLTKLFDLYPDDASAVWMYGQALHAFRTGGDTTRARELLAEAKEQNPHVPQYLLGRKRLPRTLPATVGFGDEREAIYSAAEQMAAWRKAPGALAWLDKHAG